MTRELPATAVAGLRAPVRPPPARKRLGTRFDQDDEDPRASLVNLVDVMLVFACGLLAALSASAPSARTVQEVSRGRAIERPPPGQSMAGRGYLPVGEVFRDPVTGKLVLVEAEAGQAAVPSAAPTAGPPPSPERRDGPAQ